MRVIIRPPTLQDQHPFLRAARRSKRLHRAWVQAPYDAAAFSGYLRLTGDLNAGFLVCLAGAAADEPVGVINLNNIVRAGLQGASLGFYAFAPHAGRSYMTEGLTLVLREAFGAMRRTGWRPTSSRPTPPRWRWSSGGTFLNDDGRVIHGPGQLLHDGDVLQLGATLNSPKAVFRLNGQAQCAGSVDTRALLRSSVPRGARAALDYKKAYRFSRLDDVKDEDTNTKAQIEHLLREGRALDAVEILEQAARRYAGINKPLRAIVCCRRALQLAPNRREISRLLAYLYARHPQLSVQPVEATGVLYTPESGSTAEAVSHPKVIVDRVLLDDGPSEACLDALRLHEVVPGARTCGPVRVGSGRQFVIPLTHTADAALVEMAMEATMTRSALPKTPLLSDLDPAALQDLIERLELRQHPAGTTIFNQGDPGDALHVLASGEVEVISEGPPRQVLARLGEGGFFGEIALLTRSVRTATVQAVGEATTLVISHELVQELIGRHPGVLVVLLKFFRERLVETLLDTSYLFAACTLEERRELAERFAFVEVEPESDLLVSGQPSEALQILLCGRIRWREVGQGSWAPLPPGAIFGVRSMVCRQRNTVDVSSVDKCWLLRMEREAFLQLSHRFPQFVAFIESLARAQEPRADDEPEVSGGLTQKINLPIF